MARFVEAKTLASPVRVIGFPQIESDQTIFMASHYSGLVGGLRQKVEGEATLRVVNAIA